MKALIVYIEDDEDARILMQRILSHFQVEMIGCETAEQGLQVIEQKKPDIILMDIQLPGMNGLEATKILKNQESTKHIPIIAITATAMYGDREMALAAGCNHYVTKPFTLNELKEILSNYIDFND